MERTECDEWIYDIRGIEVQSWITKVRDGKELGKDSGKRQAFWAALHLGFGERVVMICVIENGIDIGESTMIVRWVNHDRGNEFAVAFLRGGEESGDMMTHWLLD